MSFGWPEVAIGDAADPVDRSVAVEPGVRYRQIGVRLWGEGAYERESIDGIDTRYKTLNRTQRGDIIVNKIWARNGSVSVVLTGLEDCYCSGEFPLFQPQEDVLDPMWFRWITKTRWFWSRCDVEARGTSGKNRIRPERFLAIRIPLPPIEEQRRIVAKIERLAAKVEEARRLRANVSNFTDALQASLSDSLVPPGTKTVPLEEFVQHGSKISYGVLKPGPNLEGGVPFVRVQDLAVDRPPETPNKSIAPEIDAQYKRTRLNGGEVLVGVVGSIGKIGIAPPSWAGANIARAVARIVPSQNTSAEYLAAMLQAPRAQAYLLGTTRTLAQPTLNIGQLKKTPIPVLPLSEQEVLVSSVRESREALARLRRAQKASEIEVRALLPSILDKAFKGEL